MALGPTIQQVRKRDGHLEPFMPWKIAQAIGKALRASQEADGERARILSAHVVGRVEDRFRRRIPGVESIQDIVEETLIQHGLAQTAKASILYRQRRTEIREAKKLLGIQNDLNLTVNAVTVLEKRYLLRDDEGRVVETPGPVSEACHRPRFPACPVLFVCVTVA
ncbi:MAG: ATP cone domain-containing protein [Dehalococcoidia bacterium]|nr:ATP cone domain-containing protein [Dehalococcoidia bacterium]